MQVTRKRSRPVWCGKFRVFHPSSKMDQEEVVAEVMVMTWDRAEVMTIIRIAVTKVVDNMRMDVSVLVHKRKGQRLGRSKRSRRLGRFCLLPSGLELVSKVHSRSSRWM
jgi:hypothetical protein